MRTIHMSPALIAQMRHRALAASFREVGVPLHAEAPRFDAFLLPTYVEYDAEDARIEAAGITVGDAEEDDDFY